MTVRVSQLYTEILHTGDNNKVRVSQEFVEVLHTGDNNKVRVSQCYVEVLWVDSIPPPPQTQNGIFISQ